MSDEEVCGEVDGFFCGLVEGTVVHADFSVCAEELVHFAEVIEQEPAVWRVFAAA